MVVGAVDNVKLLTADSMNGIVVELGKSENEI